MPLGETSCLISSIGNSGASASGPMGSCVAGCNGGGGGSGRSAAMLYQCFGSSSSGAGTGAWSLGRSVTSLDLGLQRTTRPLRPQGRGGVSWCHLCSPVFSPGLVRPRRRSRDPLDGLGFAIGASPPVATGPCVRVRRRAPGPFAAALTAGVLTLPGSLSARLTQVLVPIIAIFRCARDGSLAAPSPVNAGPHWVCTGIGSMSHHPSPRGEAPWPARPDRRPSPTRYEPALRLPSMRRSS